MLMVATKSFTTTFDGKLVVVTDRQSRIDSEHAIVKQNPECSIPYRSEDEAGRSTIQGMELELSANALPDVRAMFARSIDSGWEDANQLFGCEREGDWYVLRVGRSGPNAIRSYNSFSPDWEHDDVMVQRARAAGVQWIGFLHSHLAFERSETNVVGQHLQGVASFARS